MGSICVPPREGVVTSPSPLTPSDDAHDDINDRGLGSGAALAARGPAHVRHPFSCRSTF